MIYVPVELYYSQHINDEQNKTYILEDLIEDPPYKN